MSYSVVQGSLFDDCSTHCEAYASCGGNRHTAPCGCVWTLNSGKRYKCDRCYIICREKSDFVREIKHGLDINQIFLNQSSFTLPGFVPLYTHKYKGDVPFQRFVAIDIRSLFNCRRRGPAAIKSNFRCEADVRNYFNVNSNCGLLMVFNGMDWMLESIWAMPRKSMLNDLKALGFTICTGPTFSLTELTIDNTRVPYSHHTAMLMRHHRFVSEISESGLCPVPNLYWIDGDSRQMAEWANWLINNPHISMVSKDLTSTRKWCTIEPKIVQLLALLRKTSRVFHILIVGTGGANATKVVSALRQEGHIASIITSAPIMKAIHGAKYYINKNGRLSDIPSDKTDQIFSTLIDYNIKLFENSLVFK